MKKLLKTLEGMAGLALYGLVVAVAIALALSIPIALIVIAINT